MDVGVNQNVLPAPRHVLPPPYTPAQAAERQSQLSLMPTGFRQPHPEEYAAHYFAAQQRALQDQAQQQGYSFFPGGHPSWAENGPNAKRRRINGTDSSFARNHANHQLTRDSKVTSLATASFASRAEPSPKHPHFPGKAVSTPPHAVSTHARLPSKGSNATNSSMSAPAMRRESAEEVIANLSYLHKIKTLGRIAPPLRSTELARPSRGAIIAVEGENDAAVGDVVSWLKGYLGSSEGYQVRVISGPSPPNVGRETKIADYCSLILEWHEKSKSFIKQVTAHYSVEAESNESEDEGSVDIDVLILHHYSLFASNTYAVRIPIKDAYGPADHWQWMATMWRGIVGPDLTVYVRDSPASEWASEKEVEIREEARCMIVRKEVDSSGAHGQSKIKDKSLRRLGFEVGETVRAVGASKHGGKQGGESRKSSSSGEGRMSLS